MQLKRLLWYVPSVVIYRTRLQRDRQPVVMRKRRKRPRQRARRSRPQHPGSKRVTWQREQLLHLPTLTNRLVATASRALRPRLGHTTMPGRCITPREHSGHRPYKTNIQLKIQIKLNNELITSLIWCVENKLNRFVVIGE